jgi:hypothetical protein
MNNHQNPLISSKGGMVNRQADIPSPLCVHFICFVQGTHSGSSSEEKKNQMQPP